jgi:hypothetical protein
MNYKLLASAGSFIVSSSLAGIIFSPAALIPVMVVSAHEMGHFLVAKATGSQFVDYPLILPTIPFILGITHIEDVKNVPLVCYAGPVFGVASAAALTIVSLLCRSSLGIVLSSTALIFEAVALLFSSDARKASVWMKKQR